jgi:Family of unknown function (DUF6328)
LPKRPRSPPGSTGTAVTSQRPPTSSTVLGNSWMSVRQKPMMDPQESESDDPRDETHLECLDRNLEELTGEVRVVVTGVQVLFAFLLIVPFNTGFAHVGRFEQTVYLVTLILAALAAVCTIALATASFSVSLRRQAASGVLLKPLGDLWPDIPRVGYVRLSSAGEEQAVRHPDRGSHCKSWSAPVHLLLVRDPATAPATARPTRAASGTSGPLVASARRCAVMCLREMGGYKVLASSNHTRVPPTRSTPHRLVDFSNRYSP